MNLSKIFSKKTAKAGFTLIELLVVIAIIGILASVVLASLNSGRQKARDAKKAADLRQIQSVMIQLADDSATIGYDVAKVTGCTTVGSCIDSSKVTKYFPTLPKNPTGADYLFFGGVTSFCTSVDYENDTAKGFACDEEQCRQTVAGDCVDATTAVSGL